MSVSRRLLLAAAPVLAVTGAAAQTAGDDPAQLVALMQRYATALKANDLETLVGLYAPDGVFMPEDRPAAVGTAAVRAAYQTIFATLKVDLAFDIDTVEVAGDMAWLRATSKGRVKTLATGADPAGGFNILVVFRRLAGAWKIRAFLFASNRPGSSTPQ